VAQQEQAARDARPLASCPLWQQAQALSGVTPEHAAEIDEARAAAARC
jgi:hypothetical protein